MRLVLATEEQRTARDAINYPAWGPPLTVEGYIEREKRLRGHAWARSELSSWLLCAPDGSVLASCETYRMDSFVRARNGALLAGDSYGIASVFTEERLRGRGYAGRMLKLLHQRAAAEDPAAQAFILFSEVGAGIYERAGYAARPEWDEDLVFPPSEATGPGAAELVPEAELGRALARAEPPGDRFLVWPSAEQLDWQTKCDRILEWDAPNAKWFVGGKLNASYNCLDRHL
jgi:GNAT superfamily N-acetyltransferase